MFRSLHRSLSLIFIALLAHCGTVQAVVVFESSYSYTQEGNTDFSGGEEPTPTNFVDRTETTVNGTYTFNTEVIPDNPFELKARAGLDVSIDARGTDVGWERVQAQTKAKTSLIDFGIVEDFGSATEGFIRFSWIVTGTSKIKVDPKLQSDAYVIDELFTSALLDSTIDTDIPDLLLNDQALPVGQSSVDSFVPDAIALQEFVVPWTANLEVPVAFDLEVTAALNAFNFDAAGFTAELDADFTNTATLVSVEIFDSAGNLLESASFVGQDGDIYVEGDGGGGGGGDPQDVSLDIKPGSDTNPINLNSKGVLPVAVLGSEDFDVTTINVDSLLFGDPALVSAGANPVAPIRSSLEDVSGDGILDLVLKFKMRSLVCSGAIGPDSTEGELTGELSDGSSFAASDSLTIVPKKSKGGKGNGKGKK